MRRRHRLLTPLLALGLSFGVAGLTAMPAAEACMAAPRRPAVPTEKVAKIETAAAKFLFAQQADQVTAHIQINYYGDAKDFSWIVPIPAEPTVSVGTDALFTALRTATKPRFEAQFGSPEGTCKQVESSGRASAPASSKAGAPQAAPGSDVSVVSQQQVGPYESVVLKSENPQALRTWLTDNGYEVPAKLDAVMANYVAANYHFVALKLQQDRTAGDLQPIVLKYKADKPGIPVRLTSLAATPDMDVMVWVLGQNRAIPDNYNHTEINEARIDWLNKGENYRQVVTEAMNESGGKSFVTDYAGDSSTVKLPGYDESHYNSATHLKSKTNPLAFIETFRGLDYFEEKGIRGRTLAFLKRHVPKPESVTVSDEMFYANPGAYSAFGDFTVDVDKAIAELEETVVAPKKAIGELFKANPYLTALYTTISPEEMVEDPTFAFNPDMEKVANVHTAEVRKLCNPGVYIHEAPYKVTLPNKVSFLVASNDAYEGPALGTSGGRAVKIPAARSYGRCGVMGPPNIINDYTSQITKSMSDLLRQGVVVQIRTKAGATPSAGAGTTVLITIPVEELLASGGSAAFGCAGCSQMSAAPPPVQRGAGEGLAYALTFLGFFGYRRWLGRKKQ